MYGEFVRFCECFVASTAIKFTIIGHMVVLVVCKEYFIIRQCFATIETSDSMFFVVYPIYMSWQFVLIQKPFATQSTFVALQSDVNVEMFQQIVVLWEFSKTVRTLVNDYFVVSLECEKKFDMI